MADDRPPRRESVLELVLGVLSLLWWSSILIEGLGVTLVVGLTDIEPRSAALMVLPVPLIVWVVLSVQKSVRKPALYSWQ